MGSGCGSGLPPDAAADLDAGERRQHPVEHHQVGAPLVDHEQRLLAVHGLTHFEAALLQVVAQQREQRRLVLDDQNVGLHGAVSVSSPAWWKGVTSPLGRSSSTGVPVTT